MGAGLQKEEKMRCVICKQAETRPGWATVTFERDGLTLVVKRVPAEVCPNCGEEYLDETAASRLLHTAEQAAATGAQVEIREYVTA
jgi:YgiT-type zinc finger domain-containing protein